MTAHCACRMPKRIHGTSRLQQHPKSDYAHRIDRNINNSDRDRRQAQPNAHHGAQKGCQHHQALGHGPQRIFAHAAKSRLKQGLLHAQQNSQAKQQYDQPGVRRR